MKYLELPVLPISYRMQGNDDWDILEEQSVYRFSHKIATIRKRAA